MCIYVGHCTSKEIVVGPDYYSRSLMLCVLARKAASASFGKVSTTDVRLVDGHFAAPFAFGGGRWPTPLYSLKKRPPHPHSLYGHTFAAAIHSVVVVVPMFATCTTNAMVKAPVLL